MTDRRRELAEQVGERAAANLRAAGREVTRNADGTYTVAPVPNQPKTPHSTFRIPVELKEAAAEKAKAEGRTLTDVIVAALTEYVEESARA